MVSSYDRTGGNADGSAYALYRNPQTDGFVVLDPRSLFDPRLQRARYRRMFRLTRRC